MTTILAIVTMAVFAGASLGKLLRVPVSVGFRDALEVSPQLWTVIGTLEMLGVAALATVLLDRAPEGLGPVVGVCFVALMLGALGTRYLVWRRTDRVNVPLAVFDVLVLGLAIATTAALAG